jgi:hypothetical protein
MRVSFLLGIVIPVVVACGSGAGNETPKDATQYHEQRVPPDLVEEVALASRMGRLIYAQDGFAARASDAVLAATNGKLDARLRGWVVTREAAAELVTFLGLDGTNTVPLYRVRFADISPLPTVEMAEPGDIATPEQLGMFSARQKAISRPFGACSKTYNTVVLPASLIGKDGWLVYLIPGTATPGLVLVGGHYRVHVSADGANVLSVQPFSKSCLTLRSEPPSGGKLVALLVSHLVTQAPVESHVFLSLLHQKPFVVVTSRGTWEVVGERVSYHGKLE